MTAIPKPVRVRSLNFMQWVKTQPCLIAAYHQCQGPLDPHHVIPAGGGIVGGKVSDFRCVPLCRLAHDQAARRDQFEATYPVVFEYEITRLLKLYNDYRKQFPVRKSSVKKLSKIVVKCADCGREHRGRIARGAVQYSCSRVPGLRRVS